MKKTLGVAVLLLLLVTTFCYAQVARVPVEPLIDNVTNFTHTSVTGVDVSGNPGFIMLRGVGIKAEGSNNTDTDTNSNWILWVDQTGDLCMASHVTIAAYASFPSGTWSNTNMNVCTKVGDQS